MRLGRSGSTENHKNILSSLESIKENKLEKKKQKFTAYYFTIWYFKDKL